MIYKTALIILVLGLFPLLSFASDGGEKKETAGSNFVELDPLILPIVDGGQVKQTVSLIISLEVANGSAADHVRALKPRLADAFIAEIYGILNDNDAPKKGLLDINALKARLLPIAKEIVGEDKVNAILLQTVQQRTL